MSRYTRTNNFPAGQKARGSEIEAELDAIAQWAADLPDSETIWSGSVNFAQATGTANALAVAHANPWTTYAGKDGYQLNIRVAANNTAAVTLAVDGLAARPVVRRDGTALTNSDLKLQGVYSFVYNEVNERFHVDAFNEANIKVVVDNIANVNTVATNIANVNTVAGIDANVTAVAGISANVTIVAGISEAVVAAPTHAATATAQAELAASRSSAALTSANNSASSANAAAASAAAAAASAAAAAESAEDAAGGGGTGGDSGLEPWIIKSANYTAVNGDRIQCNTSGGSFTITLPENPDAGDEVIVADYRETWGTNNLSVDGNGKQIVDIALGENLALNINGSLVHFVYNGTEWRFYTQIGANSGTGGGGGGGGGGGTDKPATPENITPADNATDVTESPLLQSSLFYSPIGLTQKSRQYQLSLVQDFATIFHDSGELLGWNQEYRVPLNILQEEETYFWRVRYRDVNDTYSEYSTPTQFTTQAIFIDAIPTPAPTPSSFGAPFEGGFYAGLIWNEVTQSVTSTTIGVGSKTFVVAGNMSQTPLFYIGQAVEVRSRANPATNRLIGAVTGLNAFSLTVDVTSVEGTGTFSDWSIMAKYRVIVAPKSSGEIANIAYKNSNTAAPLETNTLSEGYRATQAMASVPDSATTYPAARFCSDLSIGGFTDWYLPARDELELLWRNLKPVSVNNNLTPIYYSPIRPDYQNLGAIGDPSSGAWVSGLNSNSFPQGASYITGSPAQTTAAAFQTGGAEALSFALSGSLVYMSSTQASDGQVWVQGYDSFPGYQYGAPKSGNVGGEPTSDSTARAVRRSII